MVATVLQGVGLALACVGVGFVYFPAGLISLGAACFFVGYQLEKSR